MSTYLVKGTVLFNIEMRVEAASENEAQETLEKMSSEELLLEIDESFGDDNCDVNEDGFHVDVESVKIIEDD